MTGTPGEPADPDDDLARELQEIAAGRAERPLFIEPSAAERARRQSVTRTGPPESHRRAQAPVLRLNPFFVSFMIGTAALAGIVATVVWLTGGKTSRMAATLPGNVPPITPAFTMADPFTGTPAQSWADGAAGITYPRARAVGQFSAAQVIAAYRTTRLILIAAQLDPQTLRGGRPAAFAALLVPSQRRYFLRHLGARGIGKTGYARSTRAWVMSFAPGSAELIGDVIKVHGYMKAMTAADGRRQVLRIHADFIFVYPVQRPGQLLDRLRIVAQQIANIDFALWTGQPGPLQPWAERIGPAVAGINCAFHDGFVHPWFAGGPVSRALGAGTPIDPYLLNPRLSFGTRCQPTTAT